MVARETVTTFLEQAFAITYPKNNRKSPKSNRKRRGMGHNPTTASWYYRDCKTATDAIRVYKLIQLANEREIGKELIRLANEREISKELIRLVNEREIGKEREAEVSFTANHVDVWYITGWARELKKSKLKDFLSIMINWFGTHF